MLTLMYCLLYHISTKRCMSAKGEWHVTFIFSSCLVIDLILESCGLIALYNLFTRL